MVPSVDPLPFKVFLGYKKYPTYTDFVAMAEMPLQGASIGKHSFLQQNFPELNFWWLTRISLPGNYRGEVHLDTATKRFQRMYRGALPCSQAGSWCRNKVH